jgi:hypothetical protein
MKLWKKAAAIALVFLALASAPISAACTTFTYWNGSPGVNCERCIVHYCTRIVAGEVVYVIDSWTCHECYWEV